jgi:hypothetical protein
MSERQLRNGRVVEIPDKQQKRKYTKKTPQVEPVVVDEHQDEVRADEIEELQPQRGDDSVIFIEGYNSFHCIFKVNV